MNINQQELAETLTATRDLILDFHAPWCAPCVALGKVLTSLESTLGARDIKVVGIDVGTENGGVIADSYGVRGLPSLVFVRSGKVLGTVTGARTRDQVLADLDKYFV